MLFLGSLVLRWYTRRIFNRHWLFIYPSPTFWTYGLSGGEGIGYFNFFMIHPSIIFFRRRQLFVQKRKMLNKNVSFNCIHIMLFKYARKKKRKKNSYQNAKYTRARRFQNCFVAVLIGQTPHTFCSFRSRTEGEMSVSWFCCCYCFFKMILMLNIGLMCWSNKAH